MFTRHLKMCTAVGTQKYNELKVKKLYLKGDITAETFVKTIDLFR